MATNKRKVMLPQTMGQQGIDLIRAREDIETVIYPRLGISDAVKAKSRAIPADPVGEVIARGDAERRPDVVGAVDHRIAQAARTAAGVALPDGGSRCAGGEQSASEGQCLGPAGDAVRSGGEQRQRLPSLSPSPTLGTAGDVLFGVVLPGSGPRCDAGVHGSPLRRLNARERGCDGKYKVPF